MNPKSALGLPLLVSMLLLGASCGGAPDTGSSTVGDATDPTGATTGFDPAGSGTGDVKGTTSTFVAEVWADNWFALYVDGELVGEDSVPIATERSFNADTITFEASYPFTVAIEAKDFKETDSGLEYIGEPNQQMGDGGIVAQITDAETGEVVAATSADWSVLVVQRAPLNPSCESDPDPDATCEFEVSETPADWTTAGLDDGAWSAATVWSEADVDPKGGYDEIRWDASASLIWGTDLEVDNTILMRFTVDP